MRGVQLPAHRPQGWRALALDADDLPPWAAVCKQARRWKARRWKAVGCFDATADDLRAVLRLAAGRTEKPSAAILDSRTLRSSHGSGERAGYDGARRKRGSRLHMALDTLGHLLALHATTAGADGQTEVGRLAEAMQDATGGSVSLACVDQGTAGERAAEAVRAHGIEVEVSKLPEAKRGFVLLPRRWVVERSFAWTTLFRRLARDYKRYASTLADMHRIALVCLMRVHAAQLTAGRQQPLSKTSSP